MSHDGHIMVTPNSNSNDSTRVDIPSGAIADKTATGFLPIASSMMPDASKYYVSNYVDSTITCISIGPPACRSGDALVPTKTINLLLGGASLANYDPDHRRGILDLRRPADSDTGEPQRQVRHHGHHADRDDHHHRYGDRRTGQGPALQRRMPRRELRREEGRRLLRLRREQVLERPDRRSIPIRTTTATLPTRSIVGRILLTVGEDSDVQTDDEVTANAGHGRPGSPADTAGLQRLGAEAAAALEEAADPEAVESHQVKAAAASV